MKNTTKLGQAITQDLLKKAFIKYFKYRKNYNKINYLGNRERNSSWDLCYNYFQKVFFVIPNPEIHDIRCAGLHLGFYLTSWGMLRNSFLLNWGIEQYEELAKELHSIKKNNVVEQYEKIKNFITKNIGEDSTNTLISKIMLGVYANIPALNSFFKKAVNHYLEKKINKKNEAKTLMVIINEIFQQKINKETIEEIIEKLQKKCFLTKGLSKEKILDGIFFQLGKDLLK